MVYSYTPEQARIYKETGRRPRTSQLKHAGSPESTWEPTYTYKGQTLTKAQHDAAIASDIQKNYLDQGKTPPGKLLRMAGIRVVQAPRTKTPIKPTARQEELDRQRRMFKAIERELATRPREQRRLTIKIPAEKTLIQQFTERKDISGGMTAKEIEKAVVKREAQIEKPLPKWVTDLVGDPLKLSGKERKLVLPFYGKGSADAAKQKAATTELLNQVFKDIKRNPEKIALFAALPAGVQQLGKGLKATGATKLLTKVPKGKLMAPYAVKALSAGLGAVYSKNVYDRITEDVFTEKYKDGKTTVSKRTLPNGDIETTSTIELIPIYRKPTPEEQTIRASAIFATELAPLAIGHRLVNRGIQKGYKKQPPAKPKVKISTKIKRAGKTIKTLPTKIKTLPKTTKTKIVEAKAKRTSKKRHSAEKKRISTVKKTAKEKALKEKVPVLVERGNKLKILQMNRGKLLKQLEKAKGTQRRAVRARVKRVDREIAKAKKQATKSKVTVVTGIKKGKLVTKTVSKSEAAKIKAKVHNRLNKAATKRKKIAKLRLKLESLKKQVKSAYAKLSPKERKAKKARYNQTLDQLKTLTNKAWELEKWKIDEHKLTKDLPKFESKADPLYIRMQKARDFAYFTVSNMERIAPPVVKPKGKTAKLKPGELQARIEAKRKARIAEYERSPQVEAGGQILILKAETVPLIKKTQVLNTKAKQLVKTKPKTKTQLKQVQVVKSQLKTKTKTLLVYQGRIQKQRTVLLQVQKRIQAQRAKTTTKIVPMMSLRTVAHRISISTTLLKQIRVAVVDTKTTLKTIEKVIGEPIPKKKPVVVPILFKPTKGKKKKKAKKVSKKVKGAYIKNPVPSIRAFMG